MKRATAPEPARRKLRCAVYTRKSSEEGLEQDFNSLHAQREACEAYVASQKIEGWTLVPDRYDDGGFSGGTLERPALQRLLRDVEARRVDVVVVYKIDRLSRSLFDFAKLVEVFDRSDVTFVSVTQHFNTTTSMGRLTLNILLSFAQFEREVTGERIRDKFAASRRKGMWMGGNPPLGYDIVDRRLVANEAERRLVLDVFEGFVRTRSATRLVRELREQGAVGKRWTSTRGNDIGGRLLDKGSVYRVLTNRVYLGEAVHKGQSYPGEHDAIVPEDLWAKAQAIMTTSPRVRANATRRQTPAPLKGLMRCAHCEAAMSPTQTRKGGRLYRYYTCQTVLKVSRDACPVRSLPAGEVERAVLDQVRALALRPEIASRVAAQAHGQADAAVGATAAEREDRVRAALSRLDAIWDALFPDEQARLMALMIEGVHCAPDGLEVRLRVDGLAAVAHDLAPSARTEIAA